MVAAAADGLDTPEPSERHPSPSPFLQEPVEMHHVISDTEKAINDELMHVASTQAPDLELPPDAPKTPSKSFAWQALRSKRKVHTTLKLVL